MKLSFNFLQYGIFFIFMTIVSSGASAKTTYNETAYKYNYTLDDVADDECSDLDDPMEHLNRKVFMFNSVADHFLLRPIAKGYRAIFNDYTRDKVGNFVDNTKVPLTLVNNVLQLDANNAGISFWQFAINTTLGFGGLYDVAGSLNVKTSRQTFGGTLARYGVGPGPYIILPLFGGSSMRDVLDLPVLNSAMNPLTYATHSDFKWAVFGVGLIHQRSELLPFTDYVSKTSPDAYSVIRSTIHQYREKDLRYPASYRCKRYYSGTILNKN